MTQQLKQTNPLHVPITVHRYKRSFKYIYKATTYMTTILT